jgi:hypothetical protein
MVASDDFTLRTREVLSSIRPLRLKCQGTLLGIVARFEALDDTSAREVD